MSREALDRLLTEIRTRRKETLGELVGVTEEEFAYPTHVARWTELRRVLLRFGDHMREHANQVEGARASIGRAPTPPQRMLAEAELSWGKLLGATAGLTDADLTATPPDGGWSIQQVLDHIVQTEQWYLETIRAARAVQVREADE